MTDLENMRSIFQAANISCLEYRDLFPGQDGEVLVLETIVLGFDPDKPSEKTSVFNIFDSHGKLITVVSGKLPKRNQS